MSVSSHSVMELFSCSEIVVLKAGCVVVCKHVCGLESV